MEASGKAVRLNEADVLAEVLLTNDVAVCFANPGTSEMDFVAALDRKPELETREQIRFRVRWGTRIAVQTCVLAIDDVHVESVLKPFFTRTDGEKLSEGRHAGQVSRLYTLIAGGRELLEMRREGRQLTAHPRLSASC